jgi:hypothetical protein
VSPRFFEWLLVSTFLFLSASRKKLSGKGKVIFFFQTVRPHKIVKLHSLFTMTANVLALGEEADFEALNCLPPLNLIRSTKLHLSTETAFLPNAC